MYDCNLIVDGRGGIKSPDDLVNDPFEHVARLEELLGHPLCVVEETTVVTTTVTRRVLAITKERRSHMRSG